MLLITPLIELGSPQLDYVRAARALGIRSALCVWSWDHLSSKALIRVVPDKRDRLERDAARRRPSASTASPPDRVVVTGAQCFDQWFDRQPTRDRDDVLPPRRACRPTRPFVLYVCSALFKGSPSEAAFVRAVGRARSGGRRDAASARRARSWSGRTRSGSRNGPPEALAALARAGDVVFWGSNPVDAESRADYFDSLYHAAAVVGLNTSALVEAAIVDRPVFTMLLPEFRDNQEGTFHFHHLLTVGDGFLNVVALARRARRRSWPALLRGGAGAAESPVRRALHPAARRARSRPRRCSSTRVEAIWPRGAGAGGRRVGDALGCCLLRPLDDTLWCWPGGVPRRSKAHLLEPAAEVVPAATRLDA